jgi:hypothetical protein
MSGLFLPAVALMNRLRFRAKFVFLGSALGVVMLVLLYTIFLNLSRDIRTAERAGRFADAQADESYGPVHAAAPRLVVRRAERQ